MKRWTTLAASVVSMAACGGGGAAGTTTTPIVETASSTGWTYTEVPFTVREGSAYSVGDGRLLAWGGAPDRSGILMSDGVLVDVETGDWTAVPEAPIEARYLPAVVWTGTEFLVFGGHSFDQSFIDGAAFDPVAFTWRVIRDAPMSPAAHPSAVWTGSEMMVWLAGEDSDPPLLPRPAVGQMAAYDPVSDDWRSVVAPGPPLIDATLVATARLR